MCGIAGIFAYRESAPPVDRQELLRIREAMVHRGPDGAGLWISDDQRVGLAHRRLAIIELSGSGAQPMWNEQHTLCVTFNGEIYNYQELRKELERRRFCFHSRSDTEVLLHLYADRGKEMVHALRGMYAFGIWDIRRKGLFLARDPFGIKPLYYADDGDSFRFASQVKALLSGGCIDCAPDPAGHVGFHLWGHVPEPYTLCRAIRCLPAGATCWIGDRGPEKATRFFDVASVLRDAERNPVQLDPREQAERLRAALLDSVRHHLIADVPVGVFLSSGVDSAVITALVSEVGRRPNTVTLGFREFRGTANDEVPLAELVGRHYDTVHRTSWVGGRDFQGEMASILSAMDQPSIDGVNCYFVSKAAAAVGLKVAMSGLGGDELFGGYSSFRDIPRLVRAVGWIPGARRIGAALRLVSAPLLKRFTSPKYAGLLEYGGSYGGAYLLRRCLHMPWELPGILDPDMVRDGWAELQPVLRADESISGIARGNLKVTALETAWYMRNQLLRDADWAGMAHSLEIRVPFVDVHLLECVAPILASDRPPGKQHLAGVPAGALPAQIAARPKTGFSIPVRDWLVDGPGESTGERGLRGWSKRVAAEWRPTGCRRDGHRRRTILVFRVGQLGDTLASVPAIHAIIQRHRGDRLVLLTDRHPGKSYVSSWDVLGPTGWFDEVVFYAPGNHIWLSARALSGVVGRLQRLAPDEAYILVPRERAWQHFRDRFFFRWIVGARNIYDPGVEDLNPRAFGGRLSRVAPEWRRLRDVVPGEDTAKLDFAALIPCDELERAERLLYDLRRGEPASFLAFGPGSKMPAKVWPEENFRELGRRLLACRDDARILVLGGAEDREIGVRLREELGTRVHNLAGDLSVYGSAAVLTKCCAYVGNDTGTMHIAGIVGKPCVALFSARDLPGRWEPYGTNHIILRHEVDCGGCMLQVCERHQNRCLKLISVDETFLAVARLMREE